MPLNNTNSMDYWGLTDPKCPHCDREIDISEHELWELYKEDTHEIMCPYCRNEFQVVATASWTFSTDEQDDI